MIKRSLAVLAFLFASVLPGASSEALNLDHPNATGFRLTFSEEFDRLDASARVGSGARWYTRTPWFGDFGEARFEGSLTNGTFVVDRGALAINLRKHRPKLWTTGLLSSMDPAGNGFAQQYGYFEMRAKLPLGRGVWPAFWLIGAERLEKGAKVTAEIDIMEFYGEHPHIIQSVVHVWSLDGSEEHRSVLKWKEVEPGQLSRYFHRFGVLVTADATTFFFEGAPYWSVPTDPTHRQPMMVLVNLAAGGGWPVTDEANGAQMLVDYIRVYELPGGE